MATLSRGASCGRLRPAHAELSGILQFEPAELAISRQIVTVYTLFLARTVHENRDARGGGDLISGVVETMAMSRNHLIALGVVLIIAAGAWVVLASGGGGDGAEQQARGGPPGRGGFGGPAPVLVETTGYREFFTRVEALGTLEPKERVELTANAADRVTAVYFEDGQRVQQGDTLILLANAEERAQLDAAQATQAEARRQLERNQRLVEQNAISTLELQRSQRDAENADGQVRSLQARLGDRVLRAPFDGVLGFRMVSPGAYVSPGQQIATLIDDSEMRLEFSVPSIFATDLKPGLEITARTDDLPDQTFKGELTSVNNAIDPVTRSVRVRATLPNESGDLKAGMFMTVDLRSEPRNSLFVPEISVIAEGPSTFVFVVDDTVQPNVVHKTQVELGVRERGYAEVLSGVSEGVEVVTDGILKLRPGMPVRVPEPERPSPASIAEDASYTPAGDALAAAGLE